MPRPDPGSVLKSNVNLVWWLRVSRGPPDNSQIRPFRVPETAVNVTKTQLRDATEASRVQGWIEAQP
jgi:hypothetical protein